MQYDIAAKVLIEKCREEILRRFLGLTVTEKNNEVRFSYRLIKIYEMDAKEIIKDNIFCLMPFVPLMKHGQEMVEKADAAVYESALPRNDKADILTIMAILSGLVSKKLPQLLVSKRRDIMIESATYDIIKEEGLREGREKGLQEGILEGRKEGLQEGILEILEIRFNVVPESIAKYIQSIENLDILRILRRNSLKVSSLEEMKILLKQIKE